LTLKEIVFDMMTQAEKVEYIMHESCRYFGVTPDELKPHMKPKTELVKSRQFIIKTLADHTTLSFGSIANLLGYRGHNIIKYHYDSFADDLSDGVYGSDKVKRLYREYLNYLNL
jgi:chromosomal replication initiation ATPase DnaA